jgi:hypothetical protein
MNPRPESSFIGDSQQGRHSPVNPRHCKAHLKL